MRVTGHWTQLKPYQWQCYHSSALYPLAAPLGQLSELTNTPRDGGGFKSTRSPNSAWRPAVLPIMLAPMTHTTHAFIVNMRWCPLTANATAPTEMLPIILHHHLQMNQNLNY